jgi:hypothetical protein
MSGVWVIEAGECNMGDHTVMEVFFGTEAEADARAAELTEGATEAFAAQVPLTGTVPPGLAGWVPPTVDS